MRPMRPFDPQLAVGANLTTNWALATNVLVQDYQFVAPENRFVRLAHCTVEGRGELTCTSPIVTITILQDAAPYQWILESLSGSRYRLGDCVDPNGFQDLLTAFFRLRDDEQAGGYHPTTLEFLRAQFE